jgi:hypothetical protein
MDKLYKKLTSFSSSNLGTEMVDIYVGLERKRFVVHKKLLTSQSTYFDKALNGGFVEAGENSIHLAEDNVATVALLVAFIYRGSIPGTDSKSAPFVTFESSTISQNLPISMTDNIMGTPHSFMPTVGPAGMLERDIMQHISFQREYLLFSTEELRVADYKIGRKHLPLGTSATNLAPSQQTNLQPNTQMHSTSITSQSTGSTAPLRLNLFNTPYNSVPSNSGDPPRLTGLKSRQVDGLEPFGASRTINYPQSAGVYHKGIPPSKLFDCSHFGSDSYQLAILKLCLLADRILWPELFNAAIDGYIRGELSANRPIPMQHLDLIYGNSSPDCTLRVYAIESLCSNYQHDNAIYLPLAKKYDDFIEDIMHRLSVRYPEEDAIWGVDTLESFKIPVSDPKIL